MRRYQYIFFDLDGTLTDPKVGITKSVAYALEYFELRQHFDYVFGSELDGTRVKKGDVIAYALEKAGIVDKSQVIMVGDREHDIIGAKENGLDSIGVLYGYGDRAEHEKCGADAIVESVGELMEVLL